MLKKKTKDFAVGTAAPTGPGKRKKLPVNRPRTLGFCFTSSGVRCTSLIWSGRVGLSEISQTIYRTKKNKLKKNSDCDYVIKKIKSNADNSGRYLAKKLKDTAGIASKVLMLCLTGPQKNKPTHSAKRTAKFKYITG
jgi:hypothetical protein